MRLHKNDILCVIDAINNSNDCIYTLSLERRYGDYQIRFTHTATDKISHISPRGSLREILFYLRGFQKGANSLKPF